MLSAIYLLVTSLAGFAVLTRLAPNAPTIVRAPGGFLLSAIFTSLLTYAVAYALVDQTPNALRIGLIVSTVVGGLVLLLTGRHLRPTHLRLPLTDAVVAALAGATSWWLMNARLYLQNDELTVSANSWGDMGLHVALSRSFSVGANFPTEYPFFAGETIRYHFGFDFYAGMLQEGGTSVLWSFNLPGIIGFAAILLTTFALCRRLFSPSEPTPRRRDKGIWIGAIAMLLVVTNQSLAWRRYVAVDGKGDLWRALDPSVLWNHQGYLAVGPYTDDRISIFNTLNPYLGQTHLSVGIAIVLLLAYLVIDQLLGDDRPRAGLLAAIGITFGAAFWLNGVVWLAAAVFFAALLALWALAACRTRYRAAEAGARWRAARTEGLAWVRTGAAFAIPALALGIPAALLLSGGGGEGGLSVHLGYLACSSTKSSCHGGQMDPLSLQDWWSFAQYWVLNEGVAIPLLILAFVLGNGRDRKLIAAVTAIFVWGSIFSVGLDLGGHNHKTFNLWEILSGPYIAFAFVELWLIGGRVLRSTFRGRLAAGLVARTLTLAVGLLLVVSGVIDAMTVKNDYSAGIFGDEPTRQSTDWIVHHTPTRATFLTDYDQMYTEPTMAGRSVLLGYSAWSATSGYDVEPRKQTISAIYSAPDLITACTLIKANHIDYVVLGPHERTSGRFDLNEELFATLPVAAKFGEGDPQILIYKVADIC